MTLRKTFRHVFAQRFDLVRVFLEEFPLHLHAFAAFAQNLFAKWFGRFVDRSSCSVHNHPGVAKGPGRARASRAPFGAPAERNLPEDGKVFGEGAENGTRGACAPRIMPPPRAASVRASDFRDGARRRNTRHTHLRPRPSLRLTDAPACIPSQNRRNRAASSRRAEPNH